MQINQLAKITGCFIVFVGLSFGIIKGPNYHDIRALGMGGTTVSIVSDRSAIFHNPAGLSLIKKDVQLSFSPIAVSIDGIFITLLKQMGLQGDKLTNMGNVDQEFIDMINKYDGQWIGLEYLPEITVATENLGFGIYSVFPIQTAIESGHLIPKLGLRGVEDLVFTWAVGVPLQHENNHCGISVEYIQRYTVDSITGYVGTFDLFNKIGKNPIGVINDYAKLRHGVSFDLGFINDYKGFRFAYALKDLLCIINGEMSVPDLDLGVAYLFPQLEKVEAIKSFLISFEIADLFGGEESARDYVYEHFLKKLHLGTELDLRWAAFRFGLSQGYPTAGLGLRLGVFKIDYAFLSVEQGVYPGQWERQKHVLNMGFDIRIPRKSKLDDKQAPEIEEKAEKTVPPKQSVQPDSEEDVTEPATENTQQQTIAQEPSQEVKPVVKTEEVNNPPQNVAPIQEDLLKDELNSNDE